MSKNFQKGTQDWLLKRYLQQQTIAQKSRSATPAGRSPEQIGAPNTSLATTPAVLKTRDNTTLEVGQIEKIAEAC